MLPFHLVNTQQNVFSATLGIDKPISILKVVTKAGSDKFLFKTREEDGKGEEVTASFYIMAAAKEISVDAAVEAVLV